MIRLPHDRRALGLIMRQAEQSRLIHGPAELRSLISSLPYTADEIDRGLELLVSPDGKTMGGTLELSALDEDWIDQLLLEELIVASDTTGWTLTEKGEALVHILAAYSDPSLVWTSLIAEGSCTSRSPE